MRQIELVQQHLRDADGLPGMLAAARDAFEFVRAAAAASADQSADMYPAFTFARGAAVSGRNAIALAPSAPAGPASLTGSPAPPADDVYQVADAIAGLAAVLNARLREAAGLAADTGDRAACESAARDAEQISMLLAKAE